MTSRKDKVLQYFLSEIRNRLGKELSHIILFGSRARGDQTAQSDYDCLVVLREPSSEINDVVDEVAGEVLYMYGAVVSAFVVSEQKFGEHMQSPFLMNALREGVEL